METKQGKNGGNAFLWGLVIGGILATLLTTKRGREILRELTNLGLELFEDIASERTKSKNSDYKDEVKEDLEAEIAEVETPTPAASAEATVDKAGEPKNGNGHKRRLFKGIRRPK